jgi:hypothetical protein
MSQWDRCITRQPTATFPGAYNNSFQIVQTPGYVLINAEMIHDTRIVPISRDGHAAHADSRVRSWGGDSRGHWEGSTLVIETTNFNGGGWIATRRTRRRCAACRSAISCAQSSATRAPATRCSTRSLSTIP